MIVKINPRDVVSIPTDYNNSKGRACRYEVIGELGVKEEDAFTKTVQAGSNGSFDQRMWEKSVRPVKEGSSPFYHGYHDGRNGEPDFGKYTSLKDANDYREGVVKGRADKSADIVRYRFVAQNRTNISSTAWPFAKKD